MGEGREAPYSVPDGVSPFAVGTGAPSGGDTVLEVLDEAPASAATYLGGGELAKAGAPDERPGAVATREAEERTGLSVEGGLSGTPGRRVLA